MFKSKKIKSRNSFGEILREVRCKTGLSLKMVAKHIGINQKYLAALENDDWHKLPGEIYAKNFFKRYAQFLKIDAKELKVDFNQIPYFNRSNHSHEFKKKAGKWSFLNLPKILKITLLAIIIFIVLFYIIWQINQITQPPNVVLLYPTSDLTTHYKGIVVFGQTESEVKIKINNEEIVLDQDNIFRQTINLQTGLNNIIIEGKKRYSKTMVIERKIVYSVYPEK